MYRYLIAAALLCPILLLFSPNASGQSIQDVEEGDLSVLSGWAKWEDSKLSLRHYLNEEAFDRLEQRKRTIMRLQSKREWQTRIAHARSAYRRILGEMPERTPLNARITGTGETEFCRYERIIFESRPEMYVTCCMLIPKDIDGPRPTVLYVCGHTSEGYRSATYQNVIFNLAQKGFVVLAMDPVGQGERLMYLDDSKKKSRYGSTGEHSYVGKQTFLNGVSVASYFVWDMIRALDYLETREEVDPDRIAVQGRSGGGTQSSYIMAYDSRIAIGAPECYVTSFRRLLESIGPQDAEQCFFRGIELGFDHPDFLELRAPKPTLVIATTNDFFSIAGVHETVAEAKAAFRVFGAEENLKMVSDDAPHQSTKKNRESLYEFLRLHFDFPGSTGDIEFEPLPLEELNSTETGQILTSLGGKTVFDYNREYAIDLYDRLSQSRSQPREHCQSVQREAKRLSGYLGPSESDLMLIGRMVFDGYVVEKRVLCSEDGMSIPVLLAVPDKANQDRTKCPLTLLFPSSGKISQLSLIEKLAREGHVVLAADLAGIGETASGNREYQDPYLALMLGTSIVGIRASQITNCVDAMVDQPYVDRDRISAVAYSSTGSALLHAAVLDGQIQRISIVDGLASYSQIVMNREYQFNSSELIGGVLTGYDLPDLIAAFSPGEVLLVNMRDHSGEPLSDEEAQSTYGFPVDRYERASASSSLVIKTCDEDERDRTLHQWLVQ